MPAPSSRHFRPCTASCTASTRNTRNIELFLKSAKSARNHKTSSRKWWLYGDKIWWFSGDYMVIIWWTKRIQQVWNNSEHIQTQCVKSCEISAPPGWPELPLQSWNHFAALQPTPNNVPRPLQHPTHSIQSHQAPLVWHDFGQFGYFDLLLGKASSQSYGHQIDAAHLQYQVAQPKSPEFPQQHLGHASLAETHRRMRRLPYVPYKSRHGAFWMSMR